MAEKLEALLECDIPEDYQPLMPSRTYTYLLNDSGEEFKRKPLLLSVFTDNEEIADGKPKEQINNVNDLCNSDPSRRGRNISYKDIRGKRRGYRREGIPSGLR